MEHSLCERTPENFTIHISALTAITNGRMVREMANGDELQAKVIQAGITETLNSLFFMIFDREPTDQDKSLNQTQSVIDKTAEFSMAMLSQAIEELGPGDYRIDAIQLSEDDD